MSQPGSRIHPSATASWEPVVGAIGPKVRELRQRQGLSLQQLAARADVSAAAIHKVERGDMVPTITTLLKLASALGRPIGYFVDEDTQQAPVATHVVAANHPAPPRDWSATTSGVDAAELTVPQQRIRDVIYASIAPGGSGKNGRSPRKGEEILLVLDGTLTVRVAEERYQVQAGDTLRYPSNRSISWHNPESEPARAIWWLLYD